MKRVENVVEYKSLDELYHLDRNPRTISKQKMDMLVESIKDNPDYFEARPIICSDRTGKLVIIAGNQRLRAAGIAGLSEVPVVTLHGLTEEREREITIRDNVELGDWDFDLLANDWDVEDLQNWGVDVNFNDDLKQYDDYEIGSLKGRFGAPPYSVLDTNVLDPFAGGSVRGIVAASLGHKYTGLELRKEQVDANIEQAKDIIEDAASRPEYFIGDSNVTLDSIDKNFDMVFSCPPYTDLEVYSNDPADLSNMEYNKFLEVYSSIIKKSVAKLKEDRFAVFVVSEVRDKKGFYRGFINDTIKAFENAGANYYNEIILVNSIGSLRLRAGRQFNSGRKIGRMHQNVLVFYKGNPKKIKDNYIGLEGDFDDE